MGLEQWPGSGTAHIGYGVPGNVCLDRDRNIISARQHRIAGFVNAGTTRLVDPILEEPLITVTANNRRDVLQAFLRSLDLGSVGDSLLFTNAVESQALTAPSVLDPVIGRRISEYGSSEEATNVVYGDDTILTYYDVENSRVQRRIDVRSPIMQVDRNGIVRTRKGLLHTTNRGEAEYFVGGEFMHVSSMPSHINADVLATSVAGELVVLDTVTGKCKWKERKPRGSITSWSRVLAGMDNSPHIGLWCNRFSMATVDFREPPSNTALKTGSHVLLEFGDRQNEIRDLDAGVDGTQPFALTSYDLRWVSLQSVSPYLSVEHPVSSLDYSVSMYAGKVGPRTTRHLVTLASQLMPCTVAVVLGKTKKMPSLLEDPLYMESWPTIIPQSHITIANAAGTALYSVGREGGLYKQQWNTKQAAGEDVIDVPDPDEYLPVEADDPKHPKPFDLLNDPSAPFIYNFENVYNYIFEIPQEPAVSSKLAMNHVDEESVDSFRETCGRMWLQPLKDRAQSEPGSVADEALAERERCVSLIVNDMIASKLRSANKENAWKSLNTALDTDLQNVVELWKIDEDEDEDDSDVASSSQGWLSQPTQLGGDLMSSQVEQDIPLSQPVPSLRSSKRKSKKQRHSSHKHKKHKKGRSSRSTQ